MTSKKYFVKGMSCASCAKSIESYLSTTAGVKETLVNITNDTLNVSFDESKITEQEIKALVDELGYEMVIENTSETVNLLVEGMSCASCAKAIENTLGTINGIDEFNVNLVNNKLKLKYDSKTVKLSQVIKQIDDIGYKLMLENNEIEEKSSEEIMMDEAKKKVVISATIASIMMALMLINMFLIKIPGYIYISALLGFPVIFIIGYSVHKKAFKSVLTKKPNMDVLVSLGSMPPYLIGLLGLFLPITTFIEMATMIMTLHLVGKYLETRAKGKASQAIKKLLEMGAKKARILVDNEEIEVLTSELSVGDIMIIKPGEKIPMDGEIIEGETLIDESLATGESLPVNRKVGDSVIGATINKNGSIKVKVTKVGNDTFLAQIIQMVEACQGTKVPIQEFADRITGIFVPAILILTMLTFTSFLVFPEFHLSILRGLENALPWINTDQSQLALAFVTATAVLVIACPCALGLGTPTALMVGSGKGAENGVLIRNGEAVQTFKDIKAIAFDKTGTLTVGKPQVTDILANDENKILQIAYSLEKLSEHVLAQAIIEKAKSQDVEAVSVTNFEAISGLGVKGQIDNQTYLIGSAKLFKENNIDTSEFDLKISSLEEQAKTTIIIGNEKEILGIIGIADKLKADAPKVIKAIESLGIKTVMITGDNQKTAEAIAKQAGISHVVASVMPEGKVKEIIKLQETYGLVAMVGDGINDAPSLKQANVGIAIGTGTDIAIESSDITLINDNLDTVLKAITLSKAIFVKIKQNYFWAWFYNALAIPFAMLGLLHPMIGAFAMSLSSLNVIYNSLRLKKINLNKFMEERV